MKNLPTIFKIITLSLFIIILTNCAKATHAPTQISAADYLQLAERTQGEEKSSYQLKAVAAYISTNQLVAAEQLIYKIPTSAMSANLKNQLKLQKIRISLIEERYDQTCQQLKNFSNKNQFSVSQWQQYYTLYAKAYLQKGDIINSVNMRAKLSNYLSDETAKKQNLWSIWQALQTLNVSTLAEDAAQTPDNQLRGWLNLALLTKTWESRPDELLTQLKQWQTNHPNHPANALLPKQLKAAALNIQQQQIALLVPLSGKYKKYGQAIRNGFFTAYFDRKKHRDANANVRVYDTATNNVTTLYKTALSDGATMVVGPLQKQNIQTLINNDALSVTTLSLNSASDADQKTYDNLYTFGLSPIDEAQQAAQFATQAHHQHVIVIAKNDAWSKAIVNAFSEQWQQLGGTVVDTQWFNRQAELSADIRNVLHIQQAEANKTALEKILHEKLRYLPRRRKDFDSIFLVASPEYAKQIVPLLRFYFAYNIPVFATSHIYNNTENRQFNRDINGVFFCDMPWIIDSQHLEPSHLNRVHKNILTLWPAQSKQYARFFALGVDAFDLTYKLNKMMMLPDLSTLGATGALTLTRSQHIYRQLPWALIKKGKPQIVNS